MLGQHHEETLKDRRIVSFLPAATEMIYALGLGDRLVGVSHECDFPAEATSKPVVSRPAFDMTGMTAAQIDGDISERLRRGESIYRIDERLLRELRPHVIVTQDLCQVCAPSGNELGVALRGLDATPEVLFMSPTSIAEIESNVLDLGRVTGCEEAARALVSDMEMRLHRLTQRATGLRRVRLFIAEWVDPLFCSGHWAPEMAAYAGGDDALGPKGGDSARIAWDDVVAWAPEIIVVAPCGFRLAGALEQAAQLLSLPHWAEIPAVREGRVYAVDANAYFARPGPRVVDGAELLAHLIHPDEFDWRGGADAFAKVPLTSSIDLRAP
jgi:iron complex transport system substrate-binding protein